MTNAKKGSRFLLNWGVEACSLLFSESAQGRKIKLDHSEETSEGV